MGIGQPLSVSEPHVLKSRHMQNDEHSESNQNSVTSFSELEDNSVSSVQRTQVAVSPDIPEAMKFAVADEKKRQARRQRFVSSVVSFISMAVVVVLAFSLRPLSGPAYREPIQGTVVAYSISFASADIAGRAELAVQELNTELGGQAIPYPLHRLEQQTVVYPLPFWHIPVVPVAENEPRVCERLAKLEMRLRRDFASVLPSVCAEGGGGLPVNLSSLESWATPPTNTNRLFWSIADDKFSRLIRNIGGNAGVEI